MSTISDFGRSVRLSVDGKSTKQLGIIGAGGGALIATIALFLMNSSVTVLPLLVCLVVAGYGWATEQALMAKALTFVAATSTVMILVLIAVFVLIESIPAAQVMSGSVFGVSIPGLGMLTRLEEPLWQSTQGISSMLPMIYATFVTTVLATLVAAPLGIAGALFIAEIAPTWAREIVKPGVEILAGIPSIVYGFIGFVIINQYTQDVLGTSYGSLFAVGFVIGLMALPTVVSVAEDAITAVPEEMKSGATATGATDWQTMKSVTLPAAFAGVAAAVVLGVGRAIGETMAATVMLGHSQNIPEPIYDVFFNGETLTSVIASQYGTAVQGRHMSALYAAGVILFVTVTLLSIASQYIEWRMKQKLEGKA
jgi:phosphate transport system permease protein